MSTLRTSFRVSLGFLHSFKDNLTLASHEHGTGLAPSGNESLAKSISRLLGAASGYGDRHVGC